MHFYQLLLFSFLVFFGCAPKRVPIAPGTVPSPPPLGTEDEQYGHQVLSSLSDKFQLDYDDQRLDRVIEIVDRLTAGAGAAFDPWHVYLFRAPDVRNAAATRGNHVFIWSGMLDYVQNDDELATVLAHEIAHVLARHTDPDPNEQIKQLLLEIGSAAVGIAITRSTGGQVVGQNLGNLAAGLTKEVGSGILVYPYSRDRELEADSVGLLIMADSGFDPDSAIQFWERSSQDPAFSASLEFFSTHPPAEERLSALRLLLPEARRRFQRARREQEKKF